MCCLGSKFLVKQDVINSVVDTMSIVTIKIYDRCFRDRIDII